MPEPTEQVVNVEIFAREYAIRSSLEPDYVHRLAAYVDAKMRAAADATPNSDVLRLALLTALNLADELFRRSHDQQQQSAELSERAAALEHLVDQALR